MKRVAATITINRIPKMTARGRKNICNWLRRLAKNIYEEPEIFAEKFRSKYIYLEGELK